MRFLFIILLLSSSSVLAQQLEQLQVNFKIKNIGTYAKGTFAQSEIEGQLIQEQLDSSFLKAVIAVNSVDTGISKRDKHLLEADYFDAVQYPRIVFTSERIEQASSQRFTVFGVLEIKGQKRPITLELVASEEAAKTVYRSAFEIRRKDFGVGAKSWILSDKVKADIQFIVRDL